LRACWAGAPSSVKEMVSSWERLTGKSRVSWGLEKSSHIHVHCQQQQLQPTCCQEVHGVPSGHYAPVCGARSWHCCLERNPSTPPTTPPSPLSPEPLHTAQGLVGTAHGPKSSPGSPGFRQAPTHTCCGAKHGVGLRRDSPPPQHFSPVWFWQCCDL